MAHLTLKLVVDPHTGKRSVVVDYESDADALPMEHEDEHRALVEQVLAPEGREQCTVERSRDDETTANAESSASTNEQGRELDQDA